MADRICDNCLSRVPVGSEKCPKCGIQFENTNPGGALPNGWVLAERYTIGRYIDIDGEGVTYAAIDGDTLQRITIKEFMPVTLCAARDETGAIAAKPGCEVLFKTTRMDFAELYGMLLRMGLTEGLVQVLDVVEENNTAYAVMEKTEGPTLAEYLTKREEPLDAARAVALMRPVLDGVEAMHNANLVHRGISPENIVLESGGAARLCGFATLALRQQGSELKAKLYPGFSAPEQYAASEFEGRYTDIYALGCVLYRLVTGEVPYPANERKTQDNVKPARALSRNVPAFLSSGIARAMRLLPAERIQTVNELRLALTGEGARTEKGPFGLTRQQMIVGGAALGAVVVLLLVILLISAFTRNRGPGADSSTSISSVSSSQLDEVLPDFTGKRLEDVVDNSFYTDIYIFAEPETAYSADVEEGRIISQDPAKGAVWDGKTPIRLVVSLGVEPVQLPDFLTTPTDQQTAEAKLKELNINYSVVAQSNSGEHEPGTVLKVEVVRGGTTDLAANMVRPGRDTVVLHVAGEVSTIAMQDFIGRPSSEAIAELDRLKLQYRTHMVTNTIGFHKVGTIEGTDPPPGGAIAPAVTIVDLRIYDKYYMPNLDAYRNGPPANLQNYLNGIGVPYTTGAGQANTDPALNGLVASIDHIANSEVTSSTVVTIHLYENAPVAPDSSSTGG
ncbi:PASTA domain-containing protein [Ruminococcaceae bacterium OttesenSCG-928-O06]|nr:PASTA domain-containing protein [Ruminococcaceae bacterium OttesenSCG-928-O06]